MKIDDKIMHYEINRYTQDPAADPTRKVEPENLTDKGKTGPVAGPEQDAIVNISRASKETRMARDIVAATPAVRTDRVDAVSKKIASGAYEIDPQSIADKMVDAFLDDLT